MSEAERNKWDARYAQGAYTKRPYPTALLEEWLPKLPRGRALDVACGAGRNALFLAENSYVVDAIDISQVGLDRAARHAESRGLSVNWHRVDLDEDDFEGDAYDLVLLVRYVNKALIPELIGKLAPGGAFICEQHLVTDEDVIGPRNPAFRFQPGELRSYAGDLEILHHYEGIIEDPETRRACLSQLIARRG